MMWTCCSHGVPETLVVVPTMGRNARHMLLRVVPYEGVLRCIALHRHGC